MGSLLSSPAASKGDFVKVRDLEESDDDSDPLPVFWHRQSCSLSKFLYRQSGTFVDEDLEAKEDTLRSSGFVVEGKSLGGV